MKIIYDYNLNKSDLIFNIIVILKGRNLMQH